MDIENERTVEPQYEGQRQLKVERGLVPLGMKTGHTWQIDPRRLLFSFARYKFVAKMLSGLNSAFEIGCGDGFRARLVRQEVPNVVATDFDPIFIDDAAERADPDWPIDVRVHNILNGPVAGTFDAAFTLDVIEHVSAEDTHLFLSNICASLTEHGVLIVGSPSLNSQAFASENSKRGHINCMNGPDLRKVMSEHFHNVFMFSMNDEVVHTGYHAMAHYLFAMGVGLKSGPEH